MSATGGLASAAQTGANAVAQPVVECCHDRQVRCYACKAGLTEEDYCQRYPSTVGCPTSYNCRTREAWTAAKTAWCCANMGLGCEPRVCCHALIPSCLACKEGVTEEEYCLSHPDTAGCSTSYNCRTREAWTAAKTAWCCENMRLGCAPPVAPRKLGAPAPKSTGGEESKAAMRLPSGDADDTPPALGCGTSSALTVASLVGNLIAVIVIVITLTIICRLRSQPQDASTTKEVQVELEAVPQSTPSEV